MAVSVTTVPASNACEHLGPQSIPAGELVTEPDPDPDFDTARLWVRTRVALTVVSASNETMQWWGGRCTGVHAGVHESNL